MHEVVLGKYIGVEIPVSLSEDQKQEYLIEAILADSRVTVSKASVIHRGKRMAEEYALRLTQQGLSIEQYYQVLHTDEKMLLHKMQELAEKHLKGRAVLEMIAEKENISVTEVEFESEVEKLSRRYPLEKKKIREILTGEEALRLRNEILVKKSMDFVKEHAVETESVCKKQEV